MTVLSPILVFGAEGDLQFGTRIIPSKLIAQKEGTIQVFAKQGTSIIPEKINGLTVTSLDSSILRVLTVTDSESGFVSEVTVKAIKKGDTKLFLAAPGYTSQELPVTVYGNVLNQEKLLVKVVPDSFSFDGPFRGLVSVELADTDGFPVKATEDVTVSLHVANNNVLEIFQKTLVIKKGEYFVGTHFTIRDPGLTGKTNIFATGPNMEGKSNDITINEDDEELEVKLYVFPNEQINVFGKGTLGHIVAQLQKEDNEEPVIANKDITVKYKVTNNIFTNQNTSPNANIGESSGTFTIKKGSYWGHTTFPLLGKEAGEYVVTISTGDPLSLDTKKIKAVYYEQSIPNTPPNEGDRFVKFEGLPIFATGNKELIGVLVLEDTNNFPILSSKNLEIEIDSSDDDFLSIDPIFFKQGDGSALVFGHVSHSIPKNSDNFEINPVVEVEDESATTFETEVFGAEEESLKLVAEPLISKVLAGTEFPIVVYLEDQNNDVTNFPKDSSLFSSPSEIFEIESKSVNRGDDLIMLNSKAINKGTAKLQFTVNDVKDAEVTIESLSLKPANLFLDHSSTIFTGANDIFSVQLLNSQKLPVFSTEDIEINFVVNDPSLIHVPEKTIIKKGEYFSMFDVGPKKSGTTKITALAEGLPIGETDVVIKNLAPEINLDVPEIIENGEVFTAKIIAKQDIAPIQGLQIHWNIDGGILQISDKKTSATGEAIASIIPTSDKKIDVQATISGSFYSPSTIVKTIRVNSTSEFLAYADGDKPQEFTKLEIGGIDPVIIIVPAAIILLGYMLFKQGTLKIKPTPLTKPTQA